MEKRILNYSKRLFVLLLILSFLPQINADVISLNSGGSGNIVISPDTYIEGFFSCSPHTCTSLGYSCGTWSDGCGGTIYCGACASGETCPAGTCVTTAVTPPSGGPTTPTVQISVEPTEISLKLAINTAKDQIIKVKNLGTSTITVSVSQIGLSDLVILNVTSLTLGAGETKEVKARFVAPSAPGIFTGKIVINGKTILVSLNVQTKLLLFDSNIVVLNKDYQVAQGKKLLTEVTLIPMGDEDRLDVTLNYVIKDYNEKVYLTKSETLLVEKKMDFKRNFDTGMLPFGAYIVGLELIYPNGIATSSAHFDIVEEAPEGRFVFYIISLIFIVLISIILVIILRKVRKKKSEQTSQTK
ncbi:hypothetical protein KAR52_01615 [Candidatus Pacearchaeota archaeon]|nr:hypothetical protein [Candidatus Pacearchaeota archaeon]